MLYKTHKKFAQLFGVVGLTTAFSSALMPTFNWGYSISDNILVGTLIIMGYSAATFGGEFPDIDSPTSVPARRYPTIRRIFNAFGVKHRGKFSHDYISLAILFGTILAGAMVAFNMFWNSWVVMFPIALYILHFYGREVGNELAFHLVKDKKKRKQARTFFNLISMAILGVIFVIMGWFPISSNPSTLLQASSALKPITYVTIVFAWVGAYSHLFADMLTNEGVYLFWRRLSPAKWVMALNKVPFLLPLIITGFSWIVGGIVGAVLGFIMGLFLQYMVAKTDLKTGSKYEQIVRRVVKILLIPTTIILIYTAFGGVLS